MPMPHRLRASLSLKCMVHAITCLLRCSYAGALPTSGTATSPLAQELLPSAGHTVPHVIGMTVP